MKNVACIALACIVVLSFSTPAFCERDAYLTGFVGYAMPIDTDATSRFGGEERDGEIEWNEDGYVLGAAIGFKKENLRMDVEWSRVTITSDDEDFSVMGVLINGYYDFTTMGRTIPYLSIGVGLGSADYDGELDLDAQEAVSLFQVGAGIAFEIQEFLFIDMRYRYLSTSEMELEGNGLELDFSFSSHNILLGITKYF